MPITFLIVTSFMRQVRKSKAVTDANIDFEFVEYGMTNRIWEMEKFLYSCLFFFFLPFLNLSYYIAGVVVLIIIKTFTGGLHVGDWQFGFIKISAVWHCFFWTLLTFIASTYVLLNLVPLNSVALGILATCSVLITYFLSPVRTEAEEELADKGKDKQKKILGTLFTLLFWFLFLIHDVLVIGHLRIPTNALAWLIVISNVQMLMVVYKESRKNI